jgi:hypothetical protein
MRISANEIVFCPKKEKCVPSFSRQDPGFISRLVQEGWKVYSPGNGWVYLTYPSRIVVAWNGGGFDVAPFFREHLGRLTKKRVSAILATAPREIVLYDNGMFDTVELHAWSGRVRVCASKR